MKEIKNSGSISVLYQGAAPFLVTYCTFVSIQFTLYEETMKYYKEKVYKNDKELFEQNKFVPNLIGSFVGGAVGSGVTNALDVITINK